MFQSFKRLYNITIQPNLLNLFFKKKNELNMNANLSHECKFVQKFYNQKLLLF